MSVSYRNRVNPGRMLVMVVGNVLLGMGISIFKLSRLGNDPFSGMVMALAERTGITYAIFLMIINLLLFMMEYIAGKKYIGAGTLVNAIFLGYVVTFFYNIWLNTIGSPELMWQRVVVVCIGVVVCSFGLSLYQSSNAGVAPYDSIALIMSEKWPKINYFWHRISNDAVCALICYLAGGIIGLGTLVSAFGLGPIVHFFNTHFTYRLLKWIDVKFQGKN